MLTTGHKLSLAAIGLFAILLPMLIAIKIASGSHPVNAQIPASPPTGHPGKKGDADGNGRVDGVDFSIWLRNYKKNTSNGNVGGDFNADGIVDGRDFVIWLNNYDRAST